ncbi:MAG: phosphoglycerate kinase [Rhodospirillales bacterium]|nr:phosphoglycerate kinase [Rhodospirillales bacterium]
MKPFKTSDDFDVKGKRVLVRTDLNVPMRDGRITDTTRITRTAATLDELAKRGAIVIALSHFGRPEGRAVKSMSLKPVADALSKALGRKVTFVPDCVGPAAEKAVATARPGDVILLENLRFHPGEEKNDKAFAAKLASLGDIYVNDAFSAAHRAHASTAAIAELLPAAAGRLMQAELEALESALESPKHPVAALVGGAKISTKIDVIGHLLGKVDVLIIGGGMANTFLHAKGINVGKSLCERDMAETARRILADAERNKVDVILPSDAVVAPAFKECVESKPVAIDAIPPDSMILDIGPKSIAALTARLETLKTLLWNGPLGAFEVKPFDAGTNAVAKAAARLTKAGKLTSVAGGGDTVAALANAGVIDDFSYVSTAGGAFLEWLEGKDLPGVAALYARR